MHRKRQHEAEPLAPRYGGNMFANLQNPMAYIIAFQFAILLVPAGVAFGRYLRNEREAGAWKDSPEITARDDFAEGELNRAA